MNTGFTSIRKKADTYRSQGLHEEALELYAKFIIRSATIDPATKYFVKKQVQLIEMEMNGGDSGVTQALSADRSDLNKKDEGERAIGSDFFLDAAKSFFKSIVAFVLVGSIFFYFVDWFSEVKKNDGGEAVQKTLKVVLKKMPTFVSNKPTSTLPDNGMEELNSKLAEEEAIVRDAKAVFDPAETQEVIKNLPSPTNGNKTKTPSDDFQKDGTDYSEMPSIENKKIGTPPEEPDPASVIDYALKKRGL